MTDAVAQPLFVVVPGRLDTPTGGFVYDRAMVSGLRSADRCAGVVVLSGTFPDPSADAIDAARRRLAALPDGAWLVVDGLALTPLAPLFASTAARLNLIALIHHPLCDEPGVLPKHAAELFRRERSILSFVRGVVVTSETTRRRLADFAVPPERIAVVKPGAIDRPPTPRPKQPRRGTLEVLSVGSLIHRKGQDLLLDALAPLRDRRWRLTLVGPARDAAFARRLRLRTRALSLSHRVLVRGALPAHRLGRSYAAADLFVLASRHEGFGIVLVEALAHGLPVITTRAGAITEAVPAGSATLVPPDDKAALTAALRPLLAHRAARLRVAAGSRRAARRVRRWRTAADEFQNALDRIIAQ